MEWQTLHEFLFNVRAALLIATHDKSSFLPPLKRNWSLANVRLASPPIRKSRDENRSGMGGILVNPYMRPLYYASDSKICVCILLYMDMD